MKFFAGPTLRVGLFVVAQAAGAATPSPSPMASVTPSARPSPALSAAPAASPRAAPSVSPSATPHPSPSPSPSPSASISGAVPQKIVITDPAQFGLVTAQLRFSTPDSKTWWNLVAQGFSSPVPQGWRATFFFNNNASPIFNASLGNNGYFQSLFITTLKTTRTLFANDIATQVRNWVPSNNHSGPYTGPARAHGYLYGMSGGICGLLSAVHSMMDTFGCKPAHFPSPVDPATGAYDTDFLDAAAGASGISEDSNSGSNTTQDMQLHENSDFWDCGGQSVACGTASGFDSLQKACGDLADKKNEGSDCTLEMGNDQGGHAMRIEGASYNHKTGNCDLTVTDTGRQGTDHYSGVPSKPGFDTWSLSDDAHTTGIHNTGEKAPFWNSLKYSDVRYYCCDKN